jgi:hypothetical protein
MLDQFKAGFEEAQKQATAKQQGQQQQSLSSLGLDPRTWLTNARNAGEKKVGDEDTIEITGGVNVNALLDDLDQLLSKANSLSATSGASIPQHLTAQEREQVTEAIKDPRVEIYTGKEDRILRRLVVHVTVAPPKESQSATIGLDLSLTHVNDSPDIPEPSNAKPLQDLMSQLGGLGALAGAGSSGSSGSGSSISSEKLKKYTDCVTAAGSNASKAQDCAKLLTP